MKSHELSWTLNNSTPEDETERKNDKSETPKPLGKKRLKKIRDSETQKSPEHGTSRSIKTFSEVSRLGQNWGPCFSAVILMPVGETESPTPNCTVTFQLCQTGSDSEGLALLAIATVPANCHQASQLVLWRPTHRHLGRHAGPPPPPPPPPRVAVDRHSNEEPWGYPPANSQPAWKIEWTGRPFLYPYWWISICFVFLCFKTR